MIDGLKPHSSYKPTSLPWLREVPATWEVCRNGRLFAQRNETGYPDLPILEVSLKTGVRVRDFQSSKRKQVMSDREKYKRARSGDIAYNMMRMWQGAVGVSPVDGLVSPAYVVARPYHETNSRYFALLFRTGVYMQLVNQTSRGIVSDRNRLYWEDFKQLPSPCPQPHEQTAILLFIDHADRLIRRYIRAKKKLIALLNEQKQAIIHQAVTRGLDPDVKLKPSAVDWLDVIPEHWDEIRLKFLVRTITDGEHISPSLASEGVPLLSAKDIRDRTILYDVDKFVTRVHAAQFWRRCRPECGDVLVVSRGATIGRVAIVENDIAFCLMGSVILCKPKVECSADFLYYALNAYSAQTSLWFTSASSAQQAIYIRDVAELRLPIPSLSEREAIVRHLDASLRQIRDVGDRARSEIQLLHEYRTRLIADVVTGKLDVREAAAHLPESVEEPKAIEERDEFAELDEDMEGEELEEAVAETAT